MMKNILNSIFKIAIVIVLFIIMYSIVQLLNFDQMNYYVDSTWKETVGTLVELDRGKGSPSKFKYEYNGQKYDEYSQINSGSIVLGSKYILKINPKMPDKYVPIEWRPIFVEKEITDTVPGTVQKITNEYLFFGFYLNKDSISYNTVIFSYRDKYQEYYENYQFLPPNYKSLYPQLTKGQSFRVRYWTGNAQRAIIYLDEPISK